MTPKPCIAARLQLPAPSTSCGKCHEPCLFTSVQCSACRTHYHPGCTDLPEYYLAHWFYGRVHYTCCSCLSRDNKNEFDSQLSFVLDALERDRDKELQTVSQDHTHTYTSTTTTQNCRAIEDIENLSRDGSVTTESHVSPVSCSFPPNIDDPNPDPNPNQTTPRPTTNHIQLDDGSNNTNKEGNDNSNTQTQNNNKGSKDPAKICPHYKLHKCKFGRAGRDCPLAHPKVCFYYRFAGRDPKHGCPRTRKCEYYHPKICRASLDCGLCTNLDCPLLHLKGTKRYPPSSKESAFKESASKESAPEKIHTQNHKYSLLPKQHLSPENQQDFIVTQLKEMQKQFAEVIKLIPWHRQQQQLPLPIPASQPITQPLQSQSQPQPPSFLVPPQMTQHQYSYPPLMPQPIPVTQHQYGWPAHPTQHVIPLYSTRVHQTQP